MLHFNLDCPLRTDALSVAACASLDEFVALTRANPDNYCATCMRTDSDRYTELRKLVECWQKNLGQAHKDALIQWKHR